MTEIKITVEDGEVIVEGVDEELGMGDLLRADLALSKKLRKRMIDFDPKEYTTSELLEILKITMKRMELEDEAKQQLINKNSSRLGKGKVLPF